MSNSWKHWGDNKYTQIHKPLPLNYTTGRYVINKTNSLQGRFITCSGAFKHIM